MNAKQRLIKEESEKLQQAIRTQCNRNAGPMDGGFLCASISLLDPPEPVVLQSSASIDEVMTALQENRTGCNLIVDESGSLVGIFSERDYLLKVYGKGVDHSEPIVGYMTADPVVIAMDETIAYALTLMSQGGFRHLPVTDGAGTPLGIVSVKNIIDHLSGKVIDDLLDSDLGLEE